MSKFLTQTKTFLPMIMQKSTTDAIQIMEKYPSLCTAHQQELQKQETQKQVTPDHDSPKLGDPIHQGILNKINSAPRESLKIVVEKTSETPALDSCKILETGKVKGKSPESLRVVAVEAGNQKTMLRALILDLVEVQRRLVVLLSEGRVWLWQQMLANAASPSATSIVRMVQPRLKEREHVPVLSQVHKRKDIKSPEKDENTQDKPFKSNLWEAIQESSPEWQKSISNQLGELQKVVVEKLSK